MRVLGCLLSVTAFFGAGVILAVGLSLWGGWFVLWSLVGAFVFMVIGYALGGTDE